MADNNNNYSISDLGDLALDRDITNKYLANYIDAENQAKLNNLEAQRQAGRVNVEYNKALRPFIERGYLQSKTPVAYSEGLFTPTRYRNPIITNAASIKPVINSFGLVEPGYELTKGIDFGSLNNNAKSRLARASTLEAMRAANDENVKQSQSALNQAKANRIAEENSYRNQAIKAFNNPYVRRALGGLGLAGEVANLAQYGNGDKPYNLSNVASDIATSAGTAGAVGSAMGALSGSGALAGLGVGAGIGGAVTGAGLAGYGLGTALDKMTGASSYWANKAWELLH